MSKRTVVYKDSADKQWYRKTTFPSGYAQAVRIPAPYAEQPETARTNDPEEILKLSNLNDAERQILVASTRTAAERWQSGKLD